MSEILTKKAAVYELEINQDSELVDTTTQEVFDTAAYSRMKYGDREATALYAESLTTRLTEIMPDLLTDETPPELLIPYRAVPPACYYLSRYCLDTLNRGRLEHDQEPGRLVQIHKSSVATTDYSASSHADRMNELNTIDFSLQGRRLWGGIAVVLDDIRITGSAERKVLDVLVSEDQRVVALGYIAVLDAQQAAINPGIESQLNTFAIKSLTDLLPMIEQDNFDLNIRTLKFILAADPEDLRPFLDKLPPRILQEVVRGAADTGVDFVRQYKTGYGLAAALNTERNC